MATGHIRFGSSIATLREYALLWERYRKLQVNPYSAKLSTGGDEYDDLGPWAYHVERDWQAGIGQIKEDAGGVLFSTCETRVPKQICLPQYILQSDARNDDSTNVDARNLGRDPMTGTIEVVYDFSNVKTYAIPITTSTQPPDTVRFSFLARGEETVYVGAELRRATSPITTLAGTTTNWTSTFPEALSEESGLDFKWFSFDMNMVTAGSGNYYLLILNFLADLSIATTASAAGKEMYDLSTGAFVPSSQRIIFTTNWYPINNGGTVTAITRFNGTLYAASGTRLLKYTAASETWATVGSAAAQNITDLCIFGSTLYVGQASGNYYTCTAGDTFAIAGAPGVYFTAWNGFLYRTTSNNVYYSGDGAAWTGPSPVGHTGSAITGMSGALNTVYVATTEALYYMASGGIMRGITRWGSIRDDNGKSLINHQGMLYCIANGGVVQIQLSDAAASILPMWIGRQEDVVADYIGAPVAIVSSNNWLMAMAPGNKRSAIWVWTGQGWHFVSELPSDTCRALAYDTTTQRVWTAASVGVFYGVRLPDLTVNPINDTGSRYAYTGWVETPWINGNLVDVEKDFESVYVSGEELAAGQTVTVFWKVRGGAWQELGTVDADGEELRWSNYTTRPTAKEIKLAFRLFSNDLAKTPTIDAIRLKYRPNVTDRWQWTLTLPFHDKQEMIDGDTNPYTGAQMVAHLESLVKQTQPFFMEDVDGTTYEVVCTGYDLSLEKFEYYDDTKRPHWIAQVTVEQSYA